VDHGLLGSSLQAAGKANSQSDGNYQNTTTPVGLKSVSGFWWEHTTIARVLTHMQVYVALRQRGWPRRTR